MKNVSRIIWFILYITTGQIDPAPKCKGGALGNHRPMSYVASIFIILVIAQVVFMLATTKLP